LQKLFVSESGSSQSANTTETSAGSYKLEKSIEEMESISSRASLSITPAKSVIFNQTITMAASNDTPQVLGVEGWIKFYKMDAAGREELIKKSFSYSGFYLDGKSDLFNANDYYEQIAYQGFDPMAVLFLVMSGAKTEELTGNIPRMVQLGLERGNNIDAMMKSSSNELVATLRSLKRVYHLCRSAKGNKKAITLSRVCLVSPTLPVLTCGYAGIPLSNTQL